MPDILWRRRLRKQARQIILNLPNLPEDVDDNIFIALAAQAAEQDKKSGAYDEFMFSEDGYVSMPYEDSVDEYLALQIERTPERKGRAELPHKLRLEFFNKRVENRQRIAEDIASEVEAVAALLGEESSVLSGATKGEEGGNWSGVAPDTTSKSKHAARRFWSLLVFVIVAAIDALVVFYSLRLLTPTEQEAMFFTAPAVGVQILFPHLVGKAIGSLRRREGDSFRDKAIAYGVGISWIAYVSGMTMLRMNFLTSLYFDKTQENMPTGLWWATLIISLFILIGLGAWIMIRAMMENPHEQKYSRLRYVFLAKKRKHRRALKKLARAEADVASEQKALDEVSLQWENRAAKYPILGESAKSTYRRALVNQVGTPDFTTTYQKTALALSVSRKIEMTSRENRKTFRKFALAISILLAAVTLTACTDPHCTMKNQASGNEIPVQVAAVLAPTNNFVDFETIINASESHVLEDLGGNLKGEELKAALGRELSVIVADGVPQLAAKRTVKSLGDSEYDRLQAVKQTFGSFNLVASCAAGKLKVDGDQIPTEEETDLLAGLAIAADQFNVEGAEKRLYVLGNGIQTAGAIQMQDPAKFPKTEKYATQLAEGLESINALPDLHGATVYWYGLGQFDGTNQKLDQSAREGLVYFWQEIIARSNGVLTTENIFGQVGSGMPHTSAIKVTSIEIQTCKLIVKLYEKDGVQFEPDTNVFVSLSKAKSAAEKVARDFKEAHCEEITVHGYAAAGVDRDEYDSKKDQIDSTNSKLTLSRAKAFANLIKKAGFSGTVNTEGIGTCGTEWTANGDASESLQKLCRRVEVSN